MTRRESTNEVSDHNVHTCEHIQRNSDSIALFGYTPNALRSLHPLAVRLRSLVRILVAPAERRLTKVGTAVHINRTSNVSTQFLHSARARFPYRIDQLVSNITITNDRILMPVCLTW